MCKLFSSFSFKNENVFQHFCDLCKWTYLFLNVIPVCQNICFSRIFLFLNASVVQTIIASTLYKAQISK
jgi:hypothetical protein